MPLLLFAWYLVGTFAAVNKVWSVLEVLSSTDSCDWFALKMLVGLDDEGHTLSVNSNDKTDLPFAIGVHFYHVKLKQSIAIRDKSGK